MFNKIRKHILACSAFLLIIFSVYYGMIAVYSHFHVINGVMVMHAHPFHGQHSHTQGQLLVLNFFSHFYSDEASETVCFTIPIRPLLYTLQDEYDGQSSLSDFTDGIYWRGPPAIFFI